MSEAKVNSETILGKLARSMGIGRITNTPEQNRIIAAAARTNDFIKNSGGTLEPIPGVGGTRDALDQTAAPTAKGKAKNESVAVTGA